MQAKFWSTADVDVVLIDFRRGLFGKELKNDVGKSIEGG